MCWGGGGGVLSSRSAWAQVCVPGAECALALLETEDLGEGDMLVSVSGCGQEGLVVVVCLKVWFEHGPFESWGEVDCFV